MGKKRDKEKVEHMCGLAGRKDGFDELKSAARGARFICRECGRSASSRDRLCEAEKL